MNSIDFSKAPEGATEPPAKSAPLAAVFPDGTEISLSANRDPREVFAALTGLLTGTSGCSSWRSSCDAP